MKQDYEIAEGSWGRRAFWLLVGVAVPLALWLMNRGSEDEEPATAPPQPAPATSPPPVEPKAEGVSAPPQAAPAPEAAPEPASEPASEEVVADAAEVATGVAASAAAAAVDGAASGTAEATAQGLFPMKARLVDSKDVSHEVDIVHLDLKSVHIGPQPALEKKEKVNLHLSDGNDTLTLGAHLLNEPTEKGVQVLTLFPLRGGQKKRLQNFLQA